MQVLFKTLQYLVHKENFYVLQEILHVLLSGFRLCLEEYCFSGPNSQINIHIHLEDQEKGKFFILCHRWSFKLCNCQLEIKTRNLFACDKLKSTPNNVQIGQSLNFVTIVPTFQFRLRTDSFSTVSLEGIISLLPAAKKVIITYSNYCHTVSPPQQIALQSTNWIFLILKNISNINFCFLKYMLIWIS